jgi:uncharacterized protein
MSLFVDTSVWYAAVDTSETGNARARQILSAGDALVTTDHVLAESWTLIHHRVGREAAERFWAGLRGGGVALEVVGPADIETAWQIGQSWSDQDFSLVDRTSFAVMLRLGIERVTSFDRHFAVFRYGPRRRLSFSIVR